MKRYISVALVLLIALSTLALTGCKSGENKEMGKIETVEIDENEGADTDFMNAFTCLDAPFGYTMQSVKNGMAYMKFNVPSSFDVYVHSARHLEIHAPEKDARLHGATFHMVYGYASYGLTLMEDDTPDSASSFVEQFQWELPSFTYNIYGVPYTLREQELADETVNVTDFCDEEDAVTYTVANNVSLLTSTLDPGPDGASQITYYFRWLGIPCCMSTVVATEDVENTKKVMSYIVSSCTYLPSRVDTEQTYKLSGSTLTLPAGMMESENVLVTPLDKTSNASAGIAVGVFHVNAKETEKITEESMNSSYALQMAKSLVPGSGAYNVLVDTSKTDESPNTMQGKPAAHYSTLVTLIGSGGDDNNPLAGTFYGDPSQLLMDTLVISDGDTQHALSIAYMYVQETTAMNILNKALYSIQFD